MARHGLGSALGMAVAFGLAGCAAPLAPEPETSPQVGATSAVTGLSTSAWAQASTRPGLPIAWEHFVFPGKTPTRFTVESVAGRDALTARADSSASMVRKRVRIAPDQLTALRFSWWVPALIDDADFAARDQDDAPVRIVLAFDGDTAKFSPRDALLSELSRTLTGEPMPYATLMYSWCPKRGVGSVVVNPRTSRIRTLVVESGPQRLETWQHYERNVREDFEKAFGEPPGDLIGVAIMTDSDNTRSRARAAYGPVQLVAADGAKAPAGRTHRTGTPSQ